MPISSSPVAASPLSPAKSVSDSCISVEFDVNHLVPAPLPITIQQQPNPISASFQPSTLLVLSDDDDDDDDEATALRPARNAERLARNSLRDEALPDSLYEFLLHFGSLTTPNLFCADRLDILFDLLRDLSSVLMKDRSDVFVVDPLAASRLPNSSAECIASIGDSSSFIDSFDSGLLCRRFPRCGRRRLADPTNNYIFYFHLTADSGPVLAWYDVRAQALNGYDPTSPRTAHNLETEETFTAVQALRLLLFLSSKIDSSPLLSPSEVIALDFAESQYYRSFALPSLDTRNGNGPSPRISFPKLSSFLCGMFCFLC